MRWSAVTIAVSLLALAGCDRLPGKPDEADRYVRPDKILDFVINVGAPSPVYIRDVATVRFGIKDRETISRLDGRDSVTLLVKNRAGENIIDIADTVSPPNSMTLNALLIPSSRHSISMMSFAAIPGPNAPDQFTRTVSGTCIQISPVTTTPVISIAPKPAARMRCQSRR